MSETIFDDAGTTFRAAVAAIQGMNPHIVDYSDLTDGPEPEPMHGVHIGSTANNSHVLTIIPDRPLTVTVNMLDEISLADFATARLEIAALGRLVDYLTAFPGDKLTEAKRVVEAAQQDYPNLVSDGDDVQKALHVMTKYVLHEMTTTDLMPSLYPSIDPRFVEVMQTIASVIAAPAPPDGELLKAFRVLDENASDEHKAELASYMRRFGADKTFPDRPDKFRGDLA